MFRLSLREMLVVVALVALGIVSLKYANDFWLFLVLAITFGAIVGSVIVALVDRGRRQAFAIGFTVTAVGYACVLLNSSNSLIKSNPEFSFGFEQFPTTRLLRCLYTAIVKT